MAGFAPPSPTYFESLRYRQAADDCDHLADKLSDQAGKVYDLQDKVRGAWKGDAGSSLDRALVDRSSSLTSAAGVLRAAASELRACADKVAQKH